MPHSTAWTAPAAAGPRPTCGPTNSRRRTSKPGEAGLPEAAVDLRLETSLERPAADRHADQVLLGVAELLDHALAQPAPASSAVRTASTVIGRSNRTCSSVPPEKSMP